MLTETKTIDFEGTRVGTPIPNKFISQWKTDNTGPSSNDQISLPLRSDGTYNFVVEDWGDGSSNAIIAWDQAETTHTYAIAGTYTVTIRGTIKGWEFGGTGDSEKILDVSDWGDLQFLDASAGNAGTFNDCVNLVISATNSPNLSGVTDCENFFEGCSSLTGDFSGWDMSGVTDFTRFFQNCTVFNEDITGWDVSSSITFLQMFRNASAFNQDISSWDVSSCITFNGMFDNSDSFDQNIGSWTTSSAVTFTSMFLGNAGFDQNIGSWDITNVTDAEFMFLNATLSTANYDALLIGWEGQAQQPNVTLGGGNSTYSAGAAATARAALVSDGWTITDGGPA